MAFMGCGRLRDRAFLLAAFRVPLRPETGSPVRDTDGSWYNVTRLASGFPHKAE